MDYKRTQMLFRGLTGHAASITLIDATGSTHAVASGMMGPSNLYLSPTRPKTTKSVRAKITNAVATLRHILEAVSYTHLDVYKRQSFGTSNAAYSNSRCRYSSS